MRYFPVILLFALCGCRDHAGKIDAAVTPSRSQLANPREISAETLAHIRNYTKTTRGWPPESYELEFLDERNDLLFVFVGYKHEIKDPHRLGSDKSFYVSFDEKRMAVVQEGKLQ